MYIGCHHNLLFIVCKNSGNSITDRNDQSTAHALQNMLLFLYILHYTFAVRVTLSRAFENSITLDYLYKQM